MIMYMRCTCVTLFRMSKMIQIRNVPDELHRTLKVRAAKAGMTLSDYLLSEIERVAEKPTLAEMMERLRSREPVELDEPPDVTIRRFRDADDPRDVD
jgi:antitoxin FitA